MLNDRSDKYPSHQPGWRAELQRRARLFFSTAGIFLRLPRPTRRGFEYKKRPCWRDNAARKLQIITNPQRPRRIVYSAALKETTLTIRGKQDESSREGRQIEQGRPGGRRSVAGSQTSKKRRSRDYRLLVTSKLIVDPGQSL